MAPAINADASQSSASTHSTVSTLPNSPSPPPEEGGDFARLVPFSRASQTAFEEFARREISKGHLPSNLWYWRSNSEEQSASDNDESKPASITLTGHFRFNLKSPNLNRLGWTLGYGYGEKLPVHFPACLLESKSKYSVGETHARFSFNEYGVLMVHAGPKRRVLINTPSTYTKLRDEAYALTNQNSIITIGELQYRFEYLEWANTESYRKQLKSFMKLSAPEWEIPASLSTVGSREGQRLLGYLIQKDFASGTSGIIYSALHERTGDPVAVKRVKAKSSRELNEVFVLEDLRYRKPLSPWIINLVDVYRSQHECIIFLDPLLPENFQQLITVDPDLFDHESRLMASFQAMQGLAWLHNQAIMHRDIKPLNIGLKSRSPVHAILFDLGAATSNVPSLDHGAGTISYLAPEILDLKNRVSTTPYDLRGDIWALGLTISKLLSRTDPSFVIHNRMKRQYIIDYGAIDRAIESQHGFVPSILRKMVARVADQRGTIKEIVDDFGQLMQSDDSSFTSKTNNRRRRSDTEPGQQELNG